MEVEHVSDRTFLIHLGGKLQVVSKAPLKTRDDLSMAYTPGVARISRAIAGDPEKAWNLTIKQNTVAVVTDGTAVLGLGDIGPEAALPVMEGRRSCSRSSADRRVARYASTTDADEIVKVVSAIAPGFGGINLEDISAPRCFDIERACARSSTSRSSTTTSTAPRSSSWPHCSNALVVVGKQLEDVGVVITGAGAAGTATAACSARWSDGCRLLRPPRRAVSRPRWSRAPQSVLAARRIRALIVAPPMRLSGADVYIGLSGPGP